MALGVNIHVTVVELCTQHRSATASDRKLSRNFKLQGAAFAILWSICFTARLPDSLHTHSFSELHFPVGHFQEPGIFFCQDVGLTGTVELQ
jgi:hypothetical protein